MISYHEALKAAIKCMKELTSETELEVEIVEEDTISNDIGWIFFYQSVEYLASKNLIYSLVGNAPILVNRITGECAALGTARPVEEYLAEYRELGSDSGP
ncbi:MAG: YrhB domain-containing protein [Anderseniella sp.]